MFGHLRVKSCGLEGKDRAIYRSHFCGVCHSLHAFAGWDASLLTNYDVTLWSLVASGVSARDYDRQIERRPCTAVPFRRVDVQPLSTDMAASLASLTVLLTWAKLEDHRQDSGRAIGWLGQTWLGRKEVKARDYLTGRDYPLTSLLELPARQSVAEKSGQPTLAQLARPTQDALADAFAWIAVLAQRPDLDCDLRHLGQSVAGYVYLWDALQDLDKDREWGDFNAISAVWGHPVAARAGWEIRGELLAFLGEMERSLEQLPLGNRRKLCNELVETLRVRVGAHSALKDAAPPLASPRRNLARAGFFVRPSCDCDCGSCCCEANCCDTGGDCGCCELSLCDCQKGDACCELSCCDCCGNDGGDTVLCCVNDCDVCCCWGDRKREKRESMSLPMEPSVLADPALCPGCRHDLVERTMAGGSVLKCRKCEGVWLDGKSSVLESDIKGLLSRGGLHPSTEGIPRGSRTCPRCRSLLRSPFGTDAAETCDSCGGRFLQG